MSEAVIVAGVRTPVGKAGKGSFTHVRSDSLAAITVREVLKRAPGVKPEDIEDLILGCAMPEAEQGHERGAHGGPAGRPSRYRVRHDRQPVLLLRPAIHLPGVRSHQPGRCRGHSGGRPGEHVHDSHGRPQDSAQRGIGGQAPRILHDHGTDRRTGGREVRHQPRRAGRLFLPFPPEGHRGHPVGKVQG